VFFESFLNAILVDLQKESLFSAKAERVFPEIVMIAVSEKSRFKCENLEDRAWCAF